jgi:type IX secretion system PorP/SprF family membrane protein
MTLKLKKILVIVGALAMFVFSVLEVKSQDITYSQPYNSPTYYNPAMVGLTLGLKARFNYLKRWTGLNGNYYTYNFSADIADRNIPGSGGLGIIFQQDRQGMGYIKSTTIGVMPSVRIRSSHNTLFQVGATIAAVNRKLDLTDAVFSSQLDPIYGNIGPSTFSSFGEESTFYADFSLGALFQFEKGSTTGVIGVAAHHLTRPDQSFTGHTAPLEIKYVAHVDFIIDLMESRQFYGKANGWKLNPSFIYQRQLFMDVYQVGINAYTSYVYFGIWYKNEAFNWDNFSNMTFMVGTNVPFTDENRMKVMYSYDLMIHSEHGFVGPSHQISLVFEFDGISFGRNKPNTMRRPNQPLECSSF